MSAGRVLVVDDEPANRALARRVLEESGFQVEEAADGELALEAVARSAPDLVLLDIQMPRRDGHAVLRALKGEQKK